MRSLKSVLFIILIVLSFYFTDRIIIYMENRHPIMQQIDARIPNLRVASVDAVINENTIIPGIDGKNVNRRQSYMRMGEFGAFNETFIVFDAVRPEISLQDNKNKVIVRGNSIRRQVSIIIEPSDELKSFFTSKEIPFTVIARVDTELENDLEYIPGERHQDRIRDLHHILNRRRVNSNICLVGFSNIEFCKERQYYLVAPSVDSNSNITQLVTSIRSGEIILIRENITMANLNLILSEIRRQDLSIVSLVTLISENR